jgi:hypothetical protein
MSFHVTLSIPTNFPDNYVKKGGQANNVAAPQPGGDNRPPPYPNANANGYENVNDTDNDYANVGGQIIHDFHPLQNIIDEQLAIDGLMDGFPLKGYNGNQVLDRQFGYYHHDGKPPVQQPAAYPYVNLGYPLYAEESVGFGLGGWFNSSRTKANICRPRDGRKRTELPRNKQGTDPRPFDQPPGLRMNYFDDHFKAPGKELGLRHFFEEDPDKHGPLLMSGCNSEASINNENGFFSENVHCNASSKGPFPTTSIPSDLS